MSTPQTIDNCPNYVLEINHWENGGMELTGSCWRCGEVSYEPFPIKRTKRSVAVMTSSGGNAKVKILFRNVIVNDVVELTSPSPLLSLLKHRHQKDPSCHNSKSLAWTKNRN